MALASCQSTGRIEVAGLFPSESATSTDISAINDGNNSAIVDHVYRYEDVRLVGDRSLRFQSNRTDHSKYHSSYGVIRSQRVVKFTADLMRMKSITEEPQRMAVPDTDTSVTYKATWYVTLMGEPGAVRDEESYNSHPLSINFPDVFPDGRGPMIYFNSKAEALAFRDRWNNLLRKVQG